MDCLIRDELFLIYNPLSGKMDVDTYCQSAHYDEGEESKEGEEKQGEDEERDGRGIWGSGEAVDNSDDTEDKEEDNRYCEGDFIPLIWLEETGDDFLILFLFFERHHRFWIYCKGNGIKREEAKRNVPA